MIWHVLLMKLPDVYSKKKKQVKYQEDKLNKFKALSNFPFDKNFISDKVILVYNNNSVLL